MTHQRSTARIMRAVALTSLLVILSVLSGIVFRPLTGSGSRATCRVGTNLRCATYWQLCQLRYAEHLFRSGLHKDRANEIQCRPKGTKPPNLCPTAQ
jgi:hypothetical protein